jgi:hypothetical protein
MRRSARGLACDLVFCKLATAAVRFGNTADGQNDAATSVRAAAPRAFARAHRGIAVAALESWREGDTMNVELALLAPLVWGLGGLVAVLVLVRDRHASWEGPIRIETSGPAPLRPAA